MAGAGKKTFTAGEVLTASDVNTFLMEQSVMYFAGTAARSSAIPTPSTGMTSYIGTTGTASIPQIETYTGSAWQTPYGSTLLANVTFAAASVAVDNVFTTTYDNYKIEINCTAFTGTDADLVVYFRAGGADASTGYFSERLVSADTVIQANRVAYGRFGFISNAYPTFTNPSINLANPRLARRTTWNSSSVYVTNAGAPYQNFNSGYQDTVTAFDGLKILLSAGTSFSGNLRIYGMRNS